MISKKTLSQLEVLKEKLCSVTENKPEFQNSNRDWELSVHISLTEPTCDTAIIRPEGSNMTRYRCDRDTWEEAMTASVDLCYQEQILDEEIYPECPFTNSDDKVFENVNKRT